MEVGDLKECGIELTLSVFRAILEGYTPSNKKQEEAATEAFNLLDEIDILMESRNYYGVATLALWFGWYLRGLSAPNEGMNVTFLEEALPEVMAIVERSPQRKEFQRDSVSEIFSLYDSVNEFYKFSHSVVPLPLVFELGTQIGLNILSAESVYSKAEIEAAFKAQRTNRLRTRPLRLKSFASSELKEECQRVAVLLWESEEHSDKRLGEMCQLVWSQAYHDLSVLEDTELSIILKRALPDRPEGLKVWLRPVAPKSASRRGASKK